MNEKVNTIAEDFDSIWRREIIKSYLSRDFLRLASRIAILQQNEKQEFDTIVPAQGAQAAQKDVLLTLLNTLTTLLNNDVKQQNTSTTTIITVSENNLLLVEQTQVKEDEQASVPVQPEAPTTTTTTTTTTDAETNNQEKSDEKKNDDDAPDATNIIWMKQWVPQQIAVQETETTTETSTTAEQQQPVESKPTEAQPPVEEPTTTTTTTNTTTEQAPTSKQEDVKVQPTLNLSLIPIITAEILTDDNFMEHQAFTFFLNKFYGNDCRLVKILKLCDQGCVVSYLSRIGELLAQKLPGYRTKDVRGTWNIFVKKYPHTYSFTHRRMEHCVKTIDNVFLLTTFGFEWEVEIFFDSLEMNHIDGFETRLLKLDTSITSPQLKSRPNFAQEMENEEKVFREIFGSPKLHNCTVHLNPTKKKHSTTDEELKVLLTSVKSSSNVQQQTQADASLWARFVQFLKSLMSSDKKALAS